jgi:hypothetical protein
MSSSFSVVTACLTIEIDYIYHHVVFLEALCFLSDPVNVGQTTA